MKAQILQFKQRLGRLFDDNLKTEVWRNYFDYAIIGLILLSTLEVFLSTYSSVVEKYGNLLLFVDYFTTAAFTIEVTLRIWAADQLSDRYKGFWGRVRYCFTFYGLIDVLSTYPFYLHFLIPVPYTMLKVFRIARLLRIFRYMKAFSVLSRAMRSKKDELIVSLQFLVIVTLIMSFILYFVENEVQPEVYDNGWTSVVWAFAQYIGDPGGFADTPPITYVGRMIAVVIGIMGIAIFAVPAGLIGSAFSEIMEEDEYNQNLKDWNRELYNAFERKLDRLTGFQIVPKYVTFTNIQARLGFKQEQIFDAVKGSQNFRLISLSSMCALGGKQTSDTLAVEHFQVNTPYGCMIDRGSRITIASPSSMIDPVIGHFAYYLAKIGGFNYISRELGKMRPYQSFYNFADEQDVEHLAEYMADLRKLTSRKGSWCWCLLAASGANEPEFPEQFHFEYGGAKGDDRYEDASFYIKDVKTFRPLYEDLEKALFDKFGYHCDRQQYHNTQNPKNFAHRLPEVNTCILRVAWSVTCWNSADMEVAQLLASKLNEHICGITDHVPSAELKRKDIGFGDYLE